ncbi:MAG: SURF1 family cytochrome oxidase biogenesis protein [Novosphingobium sp.]
MLAVAAMLALGFWQLQRRAGKEAMIARFEAARSLSAAVEWPRSDAAIDAALFRYGQVRCARVLSQRATSGRNAAGEPGWAQVAHCAIEGGGEADIVLGWSLAPTPAQWSGGAVAGVVAPGGQHEPRLVAFPPLAGLQPNAMPDPANLPNNHLAYAVQWFFFAATAAVIYVLALRKWRDRR